MNSMLRGSVALVAGLAVGLLATPARAEDVAWKIDMNHTKVGFTARHLGFAKVRGQFLEFSGDIKGDAKTARLSTLVATVQTRSITTGNDKRDGHLRSDDFFNAAAFPVATLKLKSIKYDGDKVSGEVEMTIRDKTRVVPFTGTLDGVQKVNFGNGDTLRAAYTMTATINRKEFGLMFSGAAEGVSIVGDNIDITIEAEIFRVL